VAYKATIQLATKLDVNKFAVPEGIRMAQDIVQNLSLGLKPEQAFRAAAARVFPFGKRGAERYEAELDAIIADIAGQFATAMAALKSTTRTPEQNQQAGSSDLSGLKSLSDLALMNFVDLPESITTPALLLVKSFEACLPAFIAGFGLGVTKVFTNAFLTKKPNASKAGVTVVFGANATVKFDGAKKDSIRLFLAAL
jgi:hypothetical protein